MTPIDLRSDTLTRPDDEMRAAMGRAEVGDDSYGDDPTVALLEDRVAEVLGADAAMFTPSTTMSNLIAVLLWLGTGGGVLVAGERAHVVTLENDGAPTVARARLGTVPDAGGHLEPADIAAIAEAVGSPASGRLLWLENTANLAGGHAQTAAELERSAAAGREAGYRVHLDGARLMNAAVATGCDPAELAAAADTVSFSLSKALGAPAGAVLAGSSDAIAEARAVRRMLGGTMHQAGVLAAAGLVALRRTPLLALDHERTARLRAGLERLPGWKIRPVGRPTNMVFASRPSIPGERLAAWLARAGVLTLPVGGEDVRFVVHHQHTDADIDAVIALAGTLDWEEQHVG
jgi:threonine aldolase